MTDNPAYDSAQIRRKIAAIMANCFADRPQHAAPLTVKTVVASRAGLGEGPMWSADEGRLYWVDILVPAIYRCDPVTGVTDALTLPEVIGSFGLCRSGGMIAAMQGAFKGLDFASGVGASIAAPEIDRPTNRFNDGKCDSRGRFWAGTVAQDLTPSAGSLYRLDPDGSIAVMQRGVHMPNGLGWSPDDRLFYFTDSALGQISVFDFDADSGSIHNRRLFAQVPEEAVAPDGLAVDAEGFVWSAQWNGWRVVRYDPRGRVDRVVSLPVPRPTSCAFGGPDLSTLYVTSAAWGLSAEQLDASPLSGSVFAVDVGVCGLRTHSFAG